MKSLKSSISWLVKGSAIVAGSLGVASMAAPAMADQATASAAYTFTTPAGYVESYSGEITLPSGYLFQGSADATPGSVLQVEFIDVAGGASYLDMRTPVATAAADGVTPGSFNEQAAAALKMATESATTTVFGADQLDAVAAIIKAGSGVDGLE